MIMKMRKMLMLLMVAMLLMTSCAMVDTGHEAAIVSWSGKVDMTKTLEAGDYWHIKYLWTKTPEYDVKEQTIRYDATFNDSTNMATPVSVVVYFNPIKGKVNYLHANVGADYKEEKLMAFIESAVGKVIPQYSAQDINRFNRDEVERTILEMLKRDASQIYVDVQRVNFTKVTIPRAVAQLAEQTAEQLARNELASKKEEEQTNLAKARVAKAQGEYDAAVLEAKTRDMLSAPKMLELQRIENERIWAEGYAKTGKSPFGENNIYGEIPVLLKNLGQGK